MHQFWSKRGRGNHLSVCREGDTQQGFCSASNSFAHLRLFLGNSGRKRILPLLAMFSLFCKNEHLLVKRCEYLVDCTTSGLGFPVWRTECVSVPDVYVLVITGQRVPGRWVDAAQLSRSVPRHEAQQRRHRRHPRKVRNNPHWRRARKFAGNSFDAACVQCEHSIHNRFDKSARGVVSLASGVNRAWDHHSDTETGEGWGPRQGSERTDGCKIPIPLNSKWKMNRAFISYSVPHEVSISGLREWTLCLCRAKNLWTIWIRPSVCVNTVNCRPKDLEICGRPEICYCQLVISVAWCRKENVLLFVSASFLQLLLDTGGFSGHIGGKVASKAIHFFVSFIIGWFFVFPICFSWFRHFFITYLLLAGSGKNRGVWEGCAAGHQRCAVWHWRCRVGVRDQHSYARVSLALRSTVFGMNFSPEAWKEHSRIAQNMVWRNLLGNLRIEFFRRFWFDSKLVLRKCPHNHVYSFLVSAGGCWAVTSWQRITRRRAKVSPGTRTNCWRKRKMLATDFYLRSIRRLAFLIQG